MSLVIYDVFYDVVCDLWCVLCDIAYMKTKNIMMLKDYDNGKDVARIPTGDNMPYSYEDEFLPWLRRHGAVETDSVCVL